MGHSGIVLRCPPIQPPWHQHYWTATTSLKTPEPMGSRLWSQSFPLSSVMHRFKVWKPGFGFNYMHPWNW